MAAVGDERPAPVPDAGDMRGAAVVVTGAGGGIGAALARGFAASGARVAVNDLDAERALAVAREIDGVAVPGDASTVVPAARRALGGAIDVFCANAGIAPTGGPEADEDVWAAAWDVNVMAHVRAARDLVPEWLERGRGRFVATVSAAGLLTMLGSAPYSVSKHAALAFAEWMAATYRHRGVSVHAVCPQGVRTDMLRDAGPAGQALLAADAIGPEEVAEAVLAGIAEERFLILPHPRVAEYATARVTDPNRWLGGMNKMQRMIEERTRGTADAV
ncbi:SDR family oxidoreductase [Streptomyces alkaliphilus]|uniref:SDR family oxidoreductase n=1 Tax=Streptomyces alkaliphilus TaxID=1472722 RepID=UPI003F66ACD3